MKKRKIIIAVLALTMALGMSAFAANPSAARSSVSVAGSAASCAADVMRAVNARQMSRGNTNRGAEVSGDRVRCNSDADCSNFIDADNDGICDNCNNPDGCDGTGCYGRGCN